MTMTREEALNVVKEARQYLTAGNPIWDVKKINEAMSMAIEALQAEPTNGRLIDAEALYASIAKDTYLLTDRINSRDYGMFLVGIKQKIDEAPTVCVFSCCGARMEK